ncbi:hypothetical protein SAMN05720354_10740 [Nitrosospira sp. Nsp1]|nr:hypothetical protein SAMN05720354_10740 [Nitrosospira sp. Nsp1]
MVARWIRQCACSFWHQQSISKPSGISLDGKIVFQLVRYLFQGIAKSVSGLPISRRKGGFFVKIRFNFLI